MVQFSFHNPLHPYFINSISFFNPVIFPIQFHHRNFLILSGHAECIVLQSCTVLVGITLTVVSIRNQPPITMSSYYMHIVFLLPYLSYILPDLNLVHKTVLQATLISPTASKTFICCFLIYSVQFLLISVYRSPLLQSKFTNLSQHR